MFAFSNDDLVLNASMRLFLAQCWGFLGKGLVGPRISPGVPNSVPIRLEQDAGALKVTPRGSGS